MATAKSNLKALIEKQTPAVRRAFLKMIAEMKSEAQITLIISHLQAGNIGKAMLALNMDPAFLAPLDDALHSAYLIGGQDAMAGLPRIPDPFTGGRVVARFDLRNPKAELHLANISSELVTNVFEPMVDAIQAVLTENMASGVNARTAALDIVGRVNALSGKREGGIIGLNKPQILHSQTANAELLSGDPKQLRNYLTRKTRNKSLDHHVRASIKSGKPIDPKTAKQMIMKMNNKQLIQRGNMIARTELRGAMNNSKYQAYEQMVDSGKLQASQITLIWRKTPDSNVRSSHDVMEAQRRKFGTPFTSGDGNSLKHPLDASLGAPASDVLGCRCDFEAEIDRFAGLT